ncbi:MAG: nitrate/nitrite transporter [Betaproteobacteria bacterium]
MSTFARVTLPLAAANFINQSARTVMAVVGPVLAVEYALSASELGVLAACLFAAYAASQLPLGIALDKFGARRTQTALMTLTALGFFTFALSPSFAGLAAARVMLGVGISAGLMAVIKAHADWFSLDRVANLTGLAMAIGSLGSTLTTATVQAALPFLGWRAVFAILGAMALGVALWIFLSVPDKARDAGPGPGLLQDIAVTLQILRSPLFWRYAPAVGTLSMFNFVYLGLWAGPWLRDVANIDGPGRAGLLFFYTLAMVTGSIVTGNLTSRAKRANMHPFIVPIVAMGMMVVVQAVLLTQPTHYGLIMSLWLAAAFFGSAGPAGYVAIGQMFPADQTGRISTAVNTLSLGLACLVQTAIGWILDLWPRTAAGGWHPDGYSWGLALTGGMQLVAALAMASGYRRTV